MDIWIFIAGGIVIAGALIVRLIEKKTGTSFDPYNMGGPGQPQAGITQPHLHISVGTSDTERYR